ncbi:MAG TPA: MFS transporter [Albitalea sp.]|nr:MFS transporter [Albitalea sp.]
MLVFLRDNARWIVGGFLLFLFSSFGQTFFISLSAGDIRREYGLSHGSFGSLYMAATLLSAFTLPRIGSAVDRYGSKRVVLFVVPMLALAASLMAGSRHLVLLFVALYLLRLFGQGMMSHIAFTAMGRWFSAQRGKALSLATLGMNAGEASFPVLFVAASSALGWRVAWWVGAAVLLVVALPVVAGLTAKDRDVHASEAASRARIVRDWTRGEVLRDPLFYLVMLAMIPPALIGNTVFFHQVYLVELRGWSLEVFASSFTVMAGMTVVFSLVAGQLVDRLSAIALLPFYLLPMGLGCVVLGSVQASWGAFAFMALFGLSNGFSLSLFGALWPEIYGLAHLGSIRSVIVATLVFVSAVGPGLSGLLIDRGVSYPALLVGLGSYCIAVSVLMLSVSRRVQARAEHVPAQATLQRPPIQVR